MRRLLVLTALAGAAMALPATSANAYCDAALYIVTGHCANTCTIAGSVYDKADQATKDRLPDDPFLCPA
jgi:hypothetical protein